MNINLSPEDNTKDPRIFDTIREDIQRGEHYRNFVREYRGLKDFYIDSGRRSRLEAMGRFRGFAYFTWWLLKSMFFKLSPTRRLLVLAGLFFSINGISISTSHIQFEGGLLGALLILFVLLLELKDKLLARDELESGRTIQRALMPDQSPLISGWSIWIYTRPANEVGGDLVDFMKTGEDRYGLVMADVSGKGLRAALLTAKLQATLRALTSDYPLLADLCSKVNTIFHRDSPANMFASLLFLEIRPDVGTIRFVNAGHFPPIKVTQNGCEESARGELALGLSGKTRYAEQQSDLEKGDLFFIYSDGLTEATNEQGEFFGADRLNLRLPDLRRLNAREIGLTIGNELDRFVGDAPSNDDLSLLILKRI